MVGAHGLDGKIVDASSTHGVSSRRWKGAAGGQKL